MSHKHSAAWRAVPTQDVSQALRCLEGSTLSNLVHRRRRCARIVLNQILLPGGQYARGQGRSFHQTKETIVAPEEPLLISYLHWLFIQSHLIRSLPPSLSKHLGEVSCRSTHRCIRLLQVHRALWKCFMRSGVGIHWRWVLRENIIRLHHYGRDPAEPGARLRGY